MYDPRLRGEDNAELSKVELSLLARQRLKANGKAFPATCWSQRANLVAHHAVAARVASSGYFPQQALRRQAGILRKTRPQISDMFVDRSSPELPGAIARRFLTPGDVFADRLAIDPHLTGDRGNLQSLAM